MKTTLALALTALVAGAAVAAPVLAADSENFDSAYYVQQLRYDGINAVDADDAANGAFIATVKLQDGTQVFEYFDKDSFRRINIGG